MVNNLCGLRGEAGFGAFVPGLCSCKLLWVGSVLREIEFKRVTGKWGHCHIDMSVTLSVEVPTPRPCCQGVRQVETTRGGAIFKSLFDFLNVQKLTFFLHGRGAGRRWLTRHKLRRQTPLTVP